MERDKKVFFKELIAKKDRELASMALVVAHKEKVINNAIIKLKLTNKENLETNISELMSELTFTNKVDIWGGFRKGFELVHPLFFTHLLRDFPNLSLAEQKI
jgi:hypothetical protein